MKARRFLSPLALLLSISIPVTSPAASPGGAEWTETHKLTASDAGPIDYFGHSVAISGNIAIVGARQSFVHTGTAGAAYLFDVTTGSQFAKLTASDAAAEDAFGYSAAISGNTAIVGAPYDDDAGSMSGSAYLFDLTTGNQIKLTASDATEDDLFGYSVAISGNTAIVGAFHAAPSCTGSAYLFDVTSGNQLAKLSALDAAEGDYFGTSVGISGNTAIVGAQEESDGRGSAYLFDVTTGGQLAKLTASDGHRRDTFGFAVAIDDNRAVVGAPNDSDGGLDESGSAYLFDVTTGNQLAKVTASDAAERDFFGCAVGISDNTAVIGAWRDGDFGRYSGSAYLLDVITGGEIAKLTASDAAEGDSFGYSVAIDGETTIIGAYVDDNTGGVAAGAAYVFAVPEPSTLALLAMGTVGLLAYGWRYRF